LRERVAARRQEATPALKARSPATDYPSKEVKKCAITEHLPRHFWTPPAWLYSL